MTLEKPAGIGMRPSHVQRAAQHDAVVATQAVDHRGRLQVDGELRLAQGLGDRRGDLTGGSPLGRVSDKNRGHDSLLLIVHASVARRVLASHRGTAGVGLWESTTAVNDP